MQKNAAKTICLCAIVKNEELVIGRLIDSCMSIIDYWVIYDTGSTDNTKEFIKEKLKDIPGELHESEFINFGHNRTEVVRQARDKADYLLLMDADMTVYWNDNFDKNNLVADMYHIRYTGDLDFAQPLLVSGHFDWSYIGVTHEYIFCKEAKSIVDFRDLWVTHYFDGGTRSDKLERDKKLLEDAILENPGDGRNYFYLAQTYANSEGHRERAVKYYQQRVNIGGWPEEVYYSKYQIGVMLYHLNRRDDAIGALLEAHNFRPQRFEALYMAGVIFREEKKYAIAKIFLEAVKNMPYPKNDVLFVHKNQWEYLTPFELSICYHWLGEYVKAEEMAILVSKMDNIPVNIKEQNEKNLQHTLRKLGKLSGDVSKFMVTSMFTAGTPYEEEVKKLKAGLDEFGIKYEILGIKSQGSWEKNTQMKPHVIRTVMQKYHTPVLWIDADALISGKLDWFNDVDGDISYYTIKEWSEMLTGTLYFKDNQRTLEFLNKWIELNNTNNNPDAKNFQELMKVNSSLKVVPLPPEYIKIFDNKLIVTEKPIIVHNQASRKYKKLVGAIGFVGIKSFIQGIMNGQDTCSIIGNGPFKTDLSKEIDDSFVMRCNNFKIGGKYKKIGKRIDLNISSLFHEIIPDRKVGYPILGVLPISDTAYQQYTTAKQMHRYWNENAIKLQSFGNTVYTYNDNDDYIKLFNEIAGRLNAIPTVGMMAIASARMLGFKNIILSGFTFFDSTRSHYFTDKVTRPSMHHNVEVEKIVIMNWIEEDEKNGVKYVLDELMEEKLFKNVRTK